MKTNAVRAVAGRLLTPLATRNVSTGTPAAASAASANHRPATQEETPDYHKTFYHRDLTVSPCQAHERLPKPVEGEVLKFGHRFADHMIDIDWTSENGWTRPHIHRVQPLQIHPGAKVLHYALELFEGMKAYRGIDNRIRLFRPELNMQRMIRTARRAALPAFDAEELTRLISDLVRLDKDWVPTSTTSSLYIRPTLIGTDPTLGVGHANQAKLFVLTGPVGQYYSTGFQPVTLLADHSYVRAFPGGVGAFKMGCNYAPTISVSREAAAKGCQQVLWLHGENEEITEVGTMNIFVFWTNKEGELELVTPPLERGLILPGVTRRSLLDLAHNYGEFKTTERFITMHEIRDAIKEKRMREMFGAGTACVVSPVSRILWRQAKTNNYEELLIPTMESQPNLMQRFYQDIVDIQYGRLEMPGWTREV